MYSFSFVSSFLLNLPVFFEIHHIVHISVVYSFLYVLVINWVLNDDFNKEREIGKGSGLGQRLVTF